MSDIVARLRETETDIYSPPEVAVECREAANEIERLRGLLREAHLALSFMPDPTRKLLDLRYRVREALGE